MGCYVNPQDESKEEFLERDGFELPGVPARDDFPPGTLPVCLIDNLIFTAAAVAYSPAELEALNRPDDERPKRWFVVDIEKLLVVAPELRAARRRT